MLKHRGLVMKKVILYIALSLDGYIADNGGAIDWLGGQDKNYEGDYGYSGFIAGIDTVVLGYTTYHQVTTELSPGLWPYTGMTSYVLTHRKIADTDEIKYTNQPAHELITSLRQQNGKAIWICGGANVINQLIRHDFIDEYHLAIMPILLGKGIRLFEEHDGEIQLHLLSSSSENGVLNCIYQKR